MNKAAEDLAVKSLQRILQNKHTEQDLSSLVSLLRRVEAFSELSEFVCQTYPSVIQSGEKNLYIQSAESLTIELQGRKYSEEETQSIATTICNFVGEKIDRSLKDGLHERSTPSYIREKHDSNSGLLVQHFTCINEYSVFAFIQACFPQKVADVLGLKATPVVLETVVLDSLRKFVQESGNEWFLYDIFNETASVKYSINSTGVTNQGFSGRGGKAGNRQIFIQSKEDFESESLEYRHEEIDFGYTPIYANFPKEESAFQNSTLIPSSSLHTPTRLLYYPRFSEIFSHNDSAQIYQYPYGSGKGKDEWIMKVVRNNPDLRGLMLFEYITFQDKHSKSLFVGCGVEAPKGVSCIAPTLYLRFADISNTRQESIYLGTLTFQTSSNSPYETTVVNNRRQGEIRKGELTHVDCNVELPPGSHILVPLEWGLDSKSHQKRLQLYEGFEVKEKREFLGRWYVGKIPRKKSIEDDFLKVLSRKVGRGGYLSLPAEKVNAILTDSCEFTNETLESLCAKSSFFEKHHTRAAIGTFMDLDSLEADGKSIKIRRPNDLTKLSMSAYFMYGSCPYLHAYDCKRNYWKNFGTILNGHQSPNLMGDFTLYLGSNISAIRVEEQDPEVTYISKLSIVAWEKETDTRTTFHVLDLSGLAANIKIEQGNFFEVQFSDYLEDEKCFFSESFVFYLEISGYYEILVPPGLG